MYDKYKGWCEVRWAPYWNHRRTCHPLFFLYHHRVGIFPRCLPPEWDIVRDRKRSWHIGHHRGLGGVLGNAPRSGELTSFVWEVGEGPSGVL